MIHKIGITQHPHIGVPQDLKGGDEVVNSLIKKVLENAGYQVDYILYDCTKVIAILNYFKSDGSIYKIFKKIVRIFLPLLYSRFLCSISSNYDIIICDSTVLFFTKHHKYINYFHGTYYGYKKRVAKFAFGFSENITHKILSYIQEHGAKNTYNVVVSDYVARDMRDLGLKVGKVIYNCVDTEKFRPHSILEKKGCLYAGGYAYYGKGFDVLEKLAAKGIPIDCVTNIHQGKNLNFIDSVDHEKMPEIYNGYKILIYPSRSEACQMVPLEAMSCGLPVVISNVGFAPELKKVIPEFVVEGYDELAVNEYASKIRHILGHYEEYSLMAREYVLKNHSHDKFKNEWKNTIIEFNSWRK